MAERTKNGKIFNDVHYQSLENITDTTTTNFNQTDTLCGCGSYQPAAVQRLSNPIVFTAHAGLLLAVYFCGVTYFNGILTTIERQFQLSSSEVAALSVLNDASNLCLILFVTYFGHKSHRPRWVAMGALLIAVGQIFCAMPHFLSDAIDPQSLVAGGMDTADIGAPESSGVCDTGAQIHDMYHQVVDNSTIDECRGISSKGLGLVKWLVLGQITMGCGAAPTFPLVLSYIDDAVKKHKFTSYTAFLFIAVLIGPIGGFFLTSTATSLYVDFDRVPADEIPDLEQYDPRWIGAWWLAFPLFGILQVVAAIPMFFYPKVMTVKPTEKCAEDNHNPEEGERAEDADSIPMTTRGIFEDTSGGLIKGLKGILLAIKRLLLNVPLMLLCMGSTTETANGAISSTFQVKYFQTQFGASPGTAALLMGGIVVPCVIVGQVVSAIICRRFKLNTKQCAAFILCCHIVGFLSMTVQVFVGCENTPIAGINTPYSVSDMYTTAQPSGESASPEYQTIEPIKLESACNTECACSDQIFRPVCGADGISYISPCHAGCMQFNSSEPMKYGQCTCISVRHSGSGDVIDDTAVAGLCRDSCDSTKQLTILMSVSVVATFVMSLTFNPGVFVTLRLVDADDRSFVMGFMSVITKCLAYFPTPIIMGMIINSTCILWQYTCGDRGSCWLYDVITYRYLFVGIIMGLKFISVVSYWAVYLAIKSPKEEEESPHEDNEHEMKNLEIVEMKCTTV